MMTELKRAGGNEPRDFKAVSYTHLFDTFRRERSEAFLAAASINLFSKRCCGRNILIVLLKVGHPHYESPFLSHGRETL